MIFINQFIHFKNNNEFKNFVDTNNGLLLNLYLRDFSTFECTVINKKYFVYFDKINFLSLAYLILI